MFSLRPYCIFLIFLFAAGDSLVLAGAGWAGPNDTAPVYRIMGAETAAGQGTVQELSMAQLEAMGSDDIPSAYFDRGMDFKDSRFRVISLARLLKRYDPDGRADALLLNCFDDYQGIVSVTDIRRHDLRLATRIDLAPGSVRPDWLNPLLIIVPDGSTAPFLERFLTANIRELRFVRLDDYYAPLDRFAGSSVKAGKGLRSFKDNCLFCHSLKGVGGNKGGSLPDRFDFSRPAGREGFKNAFAAFHHKDNADKQNTEQFVTSQQLDAITNLLRRLAVGGKGQ